MTVATWYLFDGGRVLFNMDARRRRLGWMRQNPRVSLTALDESWYRHVSLYGEVVEFVDDADLIDIDRLASHYTGRPFGNREARRVSAWMQPVAWHGWDPGGVLVVSAGPHSRRC
jgi:hypothetical protein